MSFDIQNIKIGVVGLGYVGLPLAVEFGKKYPTEVTPEGLASADQLSYTSEVSALADCNFYIVTVPTPVADDNRPVLTPLKAASRTLATVLKAGDVVVYESTVYPGAT